MKNYIGLVNDHSGSMSHLAKAAASDYNTNITAIKDAASREMLDTVVSVVGIGLSNNGHGVVRQVQISNPHVLKPIQSWPTPGGTPLWDGVGEMIELFESLPDANSPDVSFLVITTTDGEEMHSTRYTRYSLAAKIQSLQQSGRWTFVFRVPKGNRNSLNGLGVPIDNIQEWETTATGIAKSTVATTQAMDNYFTTRSAGARSSNAFYANASSVNTSALKDISSDVSLYIVADSQMGMEIREFILTKRMEYLKGSAFYQLTKTEARVQHDKLIIVRDRTTGAFYAGKAARGMIGLPTDRNARLHPDDHGNFDIFIQSKSVNRKLVAGTGVVYWAAIGTPFTEADLEYLKPKVANGVVQLPTVAPTNRPTPSPIPKKVAVKMSSAASINGRPVKCFRTRDEARDYARPLGKVVKDINEFSSVFNATGRWFVFI